MTKFWSGFDDRTAAFPIRALKRVEGNFTEYDDHSNLSHDVELPDEEHTAMLELTHDGFVIGRGAMHRGRDVTIP